jgi:hypothetical protein
MVNDPSKVTTDGGLMSKRISRILALMGVSAMLAIGGAGVAQASPDHSGHHGDWTDKQCKNQRAQWQKAHKHPTAKQKKQENNLLKKHSCTERV